MARDSKPADLMPRQPIRVIIDFTTSGGRIELLTAGLPIWSASKRCLSLRQLNPAELHLKNKLFCPAFLSSFLGPPL